ncbi:aldo/keto reductase [Parafrankia elaeagni]|uniref:aldo/keto reductase n=1 Tax=Parafrankia elaeagni TaxID=222534 RepID=UPI00039E9C05|nr:aldo/keto reductase [Parafrankia elaeagni]
MEPRQSDGGRSRAGRPTSAQAARLTERLRRAAVDTFLEHGYDGATMEAVARAAGVTKSTLYSRYPDKRTLFIAVSSWALTRQERDTRVLEPLPDDLAAALTLIARAILARSVDPDIVRLSRMAIAESPRFPEFAVSSQATTWSPRIQVIIDLLHARERVGDVTVPDVALAAEQFFAMVGAMPAWLAAYGIYRTPEAEDERLQHAVRLFLNGILTRGPARPPATAAAAAAANHPTVAEPGTARTAATAGPHVTSSTAATRPMRYQPLGRGGLYVSPLALGTGVLGDPHQGCDQRTATELVTRYLDAGGNLVDPTELRDADIHARAEEITGAALRGRRAQVVLATSAVAAPDPARHGSRNSRRHLRAACDASLRRLGTDHIDLYQIAVDDPATPLDETVEALDDLVRAGKVLYTGAAGIPAYRLMKALAASDRTGRARFVSLQAAYGPTARSVEREHLPLLAEEGLGFIGVTGAGPAPGSDPSGPGPGYPAIVRAVAARVGCTPTQLALAWQWARPVTAVRVDARNTVFLDEVLAATGLELPVEALAEIDQHTEPIGISGSGRPGRPTDGHPNRHPI